MYTNMKIDIIFCFMCVVFLAHAEEKFPFKDLANTLAQQGYLKERENAISGKTLALVDVSETKSMIIEFHLAPANGQNSVELTINTMRYSNQAGTDDVTVYFDGVMIEQFTSDTTDNWDDFEIKQFQSPKKVLPAGTYEVKITVKTDQSGIEFDQLTYTLTNQDPGTQPIYNKVLQE